MDNSKYKLADLSEEAGPLPDVWPKLLLFKQNKPAKDEPKPADADKPKERSVAVSVILPPSQLHVCTDAVCHCEARSGC